MTRLVFPVTNDLSFDQRMQRVAGTLTEAGYAVTLVGFEKRWSVPLRPRPWREVRLRLPFRRGKAFYAVYNAALFAHLLRGPYDAVGAVDLDTLPAAWAAARLRGWPLAHDAHEYFTELPEVVDRPSVRAAWTRLAGWLYPAVRHHSTVSRGIAGALAERYGIAPAVFPNFPVLRPELRPAEHPVPGHVLYQGTLNEGRGLEAAIRATRLVDATLDLAGEGDLSEDLRRLAAAEGRDGAVRFLGYLEPDALREHTRHAWLGLNLLEARGQSYWLSLSNKFFDYVHAGLPQVAMAFPEYARFNAEHEVAVLLEEATPRAVAEAIAGLRADPARWARLRANCLRARRAWNWQAVEGDLTHFWRAVCPP